MNGKPIDNMHPSANHVVALSDRGDALSRASHTASAAPLLHGWVRTTCHYNRQYATMPVPELDVVIPIDSADDPDDWFVLCDAHVVYEDNGKPASLLSAYADTPLRVEGRLELLRGQSKYCMYPQALRLPRWCEHDLLTPESNSGQEASQARRYRAPKRDTLFVWTDG